jgi:DNA-binding MarR family transcriptional regulator
MSTAKQRLPQAAHFDSLEQEAFLNLWRTYDRLRAEEERLFSSYGITGQQYNALRLLRGQHPGTLPTLALQTQLVSRAPDITRLLDKLQKLELVERKRSASNRRIVQVGITPHGLALLKELDGPVRECHGRQLGHMPPEQLQHLIHLLQTARRPHETGEHPWA